MVIFLLTNTHLERCSNLLISEPKHDPPSDVFSKKKKWCVKVDAEFILVTCQNVTTFITCTCTFLCIPHIPKLIPLLSVATCQGKPQKFGIQRKYHFLGYPKKYQNFWSNPKTWKVFKFVPATNLNLVDKQYTFQQNHSKVHCYPYELLTENNLFIRKYD